MEQTANTVIRHLLTLDPKSRTRRFWRLHKRGWDLYQALNVTTWPAGLPVAVVLEAQEFRALVETWGLTVQKAKDLLGTACCELK